jgi:hypothetical protein
MSGPSRRARTVLPSQTTNFTPRNPPESACQPPNHHISPPVIQIPWRISSPQAAKIETGQYKASIPQTRDRGFSISLERGTPKSRLKVSPSKTLGLDRGRGDTYATTAINRPHSAFVPASVLAETASTSSTPCSRFRAAMLFASTLFESRSALVPTTR